MKTENKEGCRRCDIFGHTISLNYRGSNSYRTCFGALVSSVLIVVMVLFLAIKVNMIIIDQVDDSLQSMTVS